MARKEMTTEKKDALIQTYLVGNKADFRKAVKHMSKLELIDLLERWRGEAFGNMKIHNIVFVLRDTLKIIQDEKH